MTRPSEQATFGELPASRKHELSHRARALEQVADAHRHVDSWHKTGNVVLSMERESP